MRRNRKTRVRFIPFMRWMLQWYILSFGLIIAMMSIVLLVGEANHQHTNKVNLMREDKYIEPDFQDTWKAKGGDITMEEKKDMVKVLIPVLDILYNSDASLEDCLGALEAITGAIRDNQKDVNTKEIFKILKVLFKNELDSYEKSLKGENK